MSRNPLIVTLLLDQDTAQLLTRLRSRYFPRQRNHLHAHVTLFHAIPASRRSDLDRVIGEICNSQTPFAIRTDRVARMGRRGVMVKVLEDPDHTLARMRKHVIDRLTAEETVDGLTSQDTAQWKRAHVTIMNKEDDERRVARCLEEVIEEVKEVSPGQVMGLQLWEYQGGPWGHLRDYHFAGKENWGC